MARVVGVESPQLFAVRDELEAATERARRLVEHHDAAALRRMTSVGGWSALQCLTHLSLTTENYLPLLARAVADAPSARGSLRFGIGLMPRLLLWSLEPPYRRRFGTQPAFEPRTENDAKATLASFEVFQDALLLVLEQFDGKALDRVPIVSPFNERLRYNALAALRILAAHERRHLWQAERAAAGEPMRRRAWPGSSPRAGRQNGI